MGRIRLTPVAVVLGLVIAGAVLVKVVAFAGPPTDVGFSHQGLSPVPDCQLAPQTDRPTRASPEPATPAGDATPIPAATPLAGATPLPVASPGVMPDLSLRIEAAAGNDGNADRGLPHSLRLFTLRLAPGEPVESFGAECEVGFILLYVASGEVEFTHGVGPTGADTGQAGAVSYVRGDGGETRLAAGTAVTLHAGDTIFLEEAVFAYRNTGAGEALLLGSAVTPEWLPCAGGGCN